MSLCRQIVHNVLNVYGKGAMVYVVSMSMTPKALSQETLAVKKPALLL